MAHVTATGWTPAERQQLPCEAALGVAARLGVHAERPVILEDWNNTIVRLAPTPIVAKVGTSHFRDARLESLERELAVSAHLAARGAPVVPPTRQVPPGPHHWAGLTLTLWQHIEPVAGAELAPAETAAAIKIVHEALSNFDGSLPFFALELDDARRLLQPHLSPSVRAGDRRFLLSVVDELRAALATLPAKCQPLHGSPHGANWLLSAYGPLLLDFETACYGPVEWDLAALDDEVLAFFRDADRELIATMRRMRSAASPPSAGSHRTERHSFARPRRSTSSYSAVSGLTGAQTSRGSDQRARGRSCASRAQPAGPPTAHFGTVAGSDEMLAPSKESRSRAIRRGSALAGVEQAPDRFGLPSRATSQRLAAPLEACAGGCGR